jgi:hypothetical protein
MMTAQGWRFASVVVEKRKINPVLRKPEKFYPKFATPLLRFVLRGCIASGTTRLVICTDTLPTGHKEGVTKALKSVCSTELPKTPFWLYHHPRHSNKWIQIADYCTWGVQRKWEKGDTAIYNTLALRLEKPELDLCSFGDQATYY